MGQSNEKVGLKIHVTGIVQGVGFRPFIYNLATRYQLYGWVRNTSAGVDIELTGSHSLIEMFLNSLQTDIPPLADVERLDVKWVEPVDYTDFKIIHSQAIPDAFQPVSPDMSICPDCLRELFDKNDRRYLYPFINCTNCGPRFTIIKDIPYDRPNTTMVDFHMCETCKAEYGSPPDRRFHAQPIACPDCGPTTWLEISPFNGKIDFNLNDQVRNNYAIYLAQYLLSQGKIVAIKGLGGFHLACDATNPLAVAELRRRKLRVDKPFAIMMSDLSEAERHCEISADERRLLESQSRPIVILKKLEYSNISGLVAPNQNTIGVMLPYTPLHYLLFFDRYEEVIPAIDRVPAFTPPKSLVMTSGNLREEPIATSNEEARQKLSKLADAFLMHNRPIYNRCDDSVVRAFRMPDTKFIKEKSQKDERKINYPVRRSRGYAPFPIHLPTTLAPVFAAGAELKNTFCITRDNYAFISHHIGDMENYETLASYEANIAHYERLFRINPSIIAYDLHPDYLASRYAINRAEITGIPAIGVQHHHAHIAACMVDNGLPMEARVIGVAMDGTGFGDDQQIWGGEFFFTSYHSYERYLHLAYMPLPGGDAAIRKPARIALAYLWKAGIEWDDRLPPVIGLNTEERSIIHTQLEKKINTPMTSSMGRLFDAVASITGVRQEVNYEAQAAIELEAIMDWGENARYPIEIIEEPTDDGRFASKLINTNIIIKEIVGDVLNNLPPSIISAKFHNTIADLVLAGCHSMRKTSDINQVALSGGVWQNMSLLEKTVELLNKSGFVVYLHHSVPTNDGGLSLGQAIIAAQKLC